MQAPPSLHWLEVTPDTRCNQRCVGCFAVHDAGPSMTSRELLEAFSRGLRDGARSLWIGGGEPTLRRDLFGMLSAARKLGYTRIKLQTNGMMLATPGYAQRLADTGVTEVALALKGGTEATHDRLTRTPGAWSLLHQALEALKTTRLPLEGDALVYRSNAHELPALVRHFTPLGIARYRVWLLSSWEGIDPEAQDELPQISAVMPALLEALELSPAPDFLVSLHTPPCSVPAEHHRCLFHAPDLGMRVVNPGGHAFRLEDSPMEGGTFLPGCQDCALRARCTGLRKDYLDRYGPSEFKPVPRTDV